MTSEGCSSFARAIEGTFSPSPLGPHRARSTRAYFSFFSQRLAEKLVGKVVGMYEYIS